MADVEFFEGNKINSTPSWLNKPKEEKGMAGFLVRKGIVKSPKQANKLFVISSIFFFIISGYLVFNTFYSPTQNFYKEDLSPEEIQNLPPELLQSIPSKYDR
jgi:hypothetical protein